MEYQKPTAESISKIMASFLVRTVFENRRRISYMEADMLREQAQYELKGKAGLTVEDVVRKMLELNERPHSEEVH